MMQPVQRMDQNQHAALKACVRDILIHSDVHDWQLQGLGMLRLYLNKRLRLHVWDSRYVVPGVSTMHDHPWSFDSIIVAGEVRQHRYMEESTYNPAGPAREWNSQTLKCGPGGCLVGEPAPIRLLEMGEEIYREGDIYHQQADEIHWSRPVDGTVTLVTRSFRTDEDHARVFWPAGQEWISAEPRRAIPAEVQQITTAALRWFSEGGA